MPFITPASSDIRYLPFHLSPLSLPSINHSPPSLPLSTTFFHPLSFFPHFFFILLFCRHISFPFLIQLLSSTNPSFIVSQSPLLYRLCPTSLRPRLSLVLLTWSFFSTNLLSIPSSSFLLILLSHPKLLLASSLFSLSSS